MAEPLILTDRAATEAERGYAGWDAQGPLFVAPTDEDLTGPWDGPARMAAAMATPGAPWWPGANNTIQRAQLDGGSMVAGYKPKAVGHSTETDVFPSYSNNVHPHVTVDAVGGRFQARGHISHARAARALRNLDGGTQTNRGGARQLEIVGRVDRIEVHGVPEVLADGIGRYAAWLEAEWGIRRTFEVRVRPYPDSYGLNNGVRLSAAAWAAYSCWCTHQNVPENTHGDTGALGWVAILNKENDMSESSPTLTEIRGEVDEVGSLLYRGAKAKDATVTHPNNLTSLHTKTSAILAALGELGADVDALLARPPLTAEQAEEFGDRVEAAVREVLADVDVDEDAIATKVREQLSTALASLAVPPADSEPVSDGQPAAG